ncbi:hypothetical protein F2981_21680 (plasmid) [Sinorhizobium meliloti]|nr:hypothetical protein [Sinorhizobium meliloti]
MHARLRLRPSRKPRPGQSPPCVPSGSLRSIFLPVRLRGFRAFDCLPTSWMGGFPQDEAKAYSVIALGAAAAKFGGGHQDHRENAPRGKWRPDHGG